MSSPKLTLRPTMEGYRQADPGGVLGVKLDGGRSRYRRDVIGGSVPISARWVLDATEYDYLEDFIENAIGGGSEPFLFDGCLRGSAIREILANIVPGSYRNTQQDGLWFVTADLEAMQGAQSSLPMPPAVLPVASPMTADEFPVSGTCDWITDSISLLLDGVQVALARPLGRCWTVTIGGPSDGVHALTAKAINSAGTSGASAAVSFYYGAAAAASSYTLDGMELFDDT